MHKKGGRVGVGLGVRGINQRDGLIGFGDIGKSERRGGGGGCVARRRLLSVSVCFTHLGGSYVHKRGE